ncbi:MAG: prolipoprotein diacylglyceryl transferase [Pantoea sp. Brub]|nr:prolipoprotein diacylglyceryl transferase [Pantoea sp. Brub]
MIKHYITFPKINPIMFTIGPISLHWYGFMYFIGFVFALLLARYRINNVQYNKNIKDIDDLIYLCFFGAVLGGRIGYVFFYNISLFLKNPWYLFQIWKGGMSFHGGLLGVILILIYYSYKNECNFFDIADLISPLVPFGLGAGRLGNFINGELWGRVSLDCPLSMLFPNSRHEDLMLVMTNPKYKNILDMYGVLPRHPSQLYEFFFEGLILLIILNIFISSFHTKRGSASGLFLFMYGSFRFIIEFFRQPDPQIGLFKNIITMGQILSLPMIIIGLLIITYITVKQKITLK